MEAARPESDESSLTITDRGRIAGTRISVYDVFLYLDDGWSDQEIADLLGISSEQFQVAFQYIAEHRAEVEAVHNEIEGRNARGNTPEVEAKLAQSRAKLHAWLAERRKADGQEVSYDRNPGGR